MRARAISSVSFLVLAICYGAAAVAGFLAPYSFETQNRDLSLVPPSGLHLFDRERRFHLRPFIDQPSVTATDRSQRREAHASAKYPIRFLVTGDEYSFLGILNTRVHLFGVEAPGRVFVLGSDEFGRDVFSRLLYGSQISLIASLAAALISVLLGMILGGLCGYYGKWLDAAVMRLSDVFLAMPWLYLLLAARAALPLHMDSRQSYFLLALLMGLVGWARPARLARGVVLSVKEAEYVLAARSFGGSDVYLLGKHILPSLRGVLLTQLSLYIPQYILAEVTLSFLGLGVNEPLASWGNMLGDLQLFVSEPHPWLFAPAFALFAILLAYHGLFAYIKGRTL